MPSVLDLKDFHSRLQHLDSLLREAEQAADPASRAGLQQIVQALLELHGICLERILEQLAEGGDTGRKLVNACARDEVISGLLLLHNLHPFGVEERVQQALESVRPYLRSHGGNVELVEFDNGVVRLRLEGSCHHCSSSQVTMQQTVEQAIHGRAPEVVAIEVEQAAEEFKHAENEHDRLALTIL